MAKSSPNDMCRRALINGKLVCKCKDLPTELWSKKLCIQDVTKGWLDKNSIKKPIRKKPEKEIKALVLDRPKIKDRYSDDKDKRHYIKKMTLRDTSSWFRMRSRMTLRIKANRSAAFRDDVGCRQCNTGSTETQE